MIKLIMCLTRKPELSREEFQDYWRNNHAALFMKNAHIMRTKKYLQSHTITSPLNDGMKASRDMRDEFDGLAEVWFESGAELMEAMGSDEAAHPGQLIVADELNFIDHSASCAFSVNEVEF